DLLEAARRVGGRVRVQLAGRIAPDMRAHLSPYAHLFEHLPPMPQEELARHYHRADAFCLPSYFEGSALVVSEAMASGLPCVVTEAAGSLVTHGRDGLVVPAGAPAELADALGALLDDAALSARLGAAARRTAEAFDLASYGRRLVEAYGAPAAPAIARAATA
ncbi:MAG TPA: glycosyltransferase family 4 protein, partial [Planctomycetota bacterium]|nr:glycosyltransferase family 4 protein [Planctomycetota bacterium]